MKIRTRDRATVIAAGLTDLHLSHAIIDPFRHVRQVWPTPEGHVYNIFGYTFPLGDRGLEADIICARVADDEDLWEYGS